MTSPRPGRFASSRAWAVLSRPPRRAWGRLANLVRFIGATAERIVVACLVGGLALVAVGTALAFLRQGPQGAQAKEGQGGGHGPSALPGAEALGHLAPRH
ncbi:MAG: hypothetical protein ACRD0J_14685, partial [Acidimicrobiales bacterium]